QHLLHAGTAARTLVADYNHVARNNLIGKNRLNCSILRFKNACATGKFENTVIDTSGLDDAAVERDVAVQHGQTTILRVGMRLVPDTPILAVGIQIGPEHGLTEGDGSRDAAGCCTVELERFLVAGGHDVPALERIAHGWAVYGVAFLMNQTGAIEFGQNTHDAT